MKALLQQEESVGLRIAPLIDVVFLLLIFFLVATTVYEEEKDITIRLAEATEGKDRSGPESLLILNVKESGVIVLNQRVQTLDQIETHLREARRANPSVVVVIRCDRTTAHQHFVRVLNLCEKVGVKGVAVAVFQTDG